MRLIDADTLERKLMMMPDEELCEDCCYNVVNAIDEMPTVGGWISVKDSLPEKRGFYLSTATCTRIRLLDLHRFWKTWICLILLA